MRLLSWASLGYMALEGLVAIVAGIAAGSIALVGSSIDSGAFLAAAVLLGLLGNRIFGAWWLDPLVALFIAYVAVVEGREMWRGDAGCP